MLCNHCDLNLGILLSVIKENGYIAQGSFKQTKDQGKQRATYQIKKSNISQKEKSPQYIIMLRHTAITNYLKKYINNTITFTTNMSIG